MFYTIYQITNLLNGKIYIGKHQTKNLDDGYMGSGKHLKYAINKYGIENFKKEILFQFDNEFEMNTKESQLVTEEFCLREDTYNICVGGKGGWGYLNSNNISNIGWKDNSTEVGKKRASIGGNKTKSRLDSDPILKSKFKDNGKKYLNPKAFAGKTHSDEWKQTHSTLMKELSKGDKNSQYDTMWITNGRDSRKIKKEVDTIPEGWYKGRK